MDDAPPVTLDTSMTEADFSNKHLGVSGAIILAAILGCKTFRDSRSLSRLDLSGNSIGGTNDEPGVKAIAEALKVNRTITEINLASNRFDAKCAKILAPAIKASGSLSSLHLGMNGIPEEQMKAIIAMDKLDVLCSVPELKAGSITELDLAGKALGTEGALVLATYLKEDSGSLSKLKMDKYELPVQEIKTATELDLSNKDLNYLDAIVIAPLIKVQTTAQNHLVTN